MTCIDDRGQALAEQVIGHIGNRRLGAHHQLHGTRQHTESALPAKRYPPRAAAHPNRKKICQTQQNLANPNTSKRQKPVQWQWDGNCSHATIQAVQRALAARKLYNGPIDGVIGSKTKQALAAFQKANGLPGQGNLTVATARALGLS
ncbi:MAG: peptidoglycan-binding domain-containing protein [Hyphomonadaceae bacterium]